MRMEWIEDKRDSSNLAEIFRIRHDVFKVRLDWNVVVHDGMERDRFDDLSPTYLFAQDMQTGAKGCFRLLPTTGPYMLRDIFPELLHGAPAPCAPDILEISRFGVIPGHSTSEAASMASVQRLTKRMLLELMILCFEKGISSVVAVTDVRFERILSRAGFPTTRYGEPMLIGGVPSVAGQGDMTKSSVVQLIDALRPQRQRRMAA